ncbi:MAG: biotin transporter BioY [Oscillospiraceae bacterium]|nr:biotin transporter BioY [Oscillospiraceae bacterium]
MDINRKNEKKSTVREICYIAVFAAIITACAQLKIPLPGGVPITMQTFAIPLAGVVLGLRNGTIASLVYVLLGAIGVPVFAGFTGGMGIVFGPTGGFILTFPLMALTAGIGAKYKGGNTLWLTMWLILGAVVNFTGGLLMYAFITEHNLTISFTRTVAPFIPGAIIKILLVVSYGKMIRQSLIKARVLT